MDSETGESILFQRKPGAKFGRRYFRKVQNSDGTPIIRKIVRGDNLSRKQTKLLSESVLNEFSSMIPYSLNKQKRWKTLGSVDAVLNNVKTDNFIVSAAKRTRKPSKDFKAEVYGRIEPGFDSEIEKIKCEGKGCVVESLSNSLDCVKNGKTMKKKDKNVEKFIKPEVTVIIDPNCEHWRLFARGEAILGKVNFIGNSKTKRSNKINRLTDISEVILEDEDYEDDDDFDDDHNERNTKFNLSDFVVKDSEIKKRERIPTTNTLDEYEVVENLDTMIKAIDNATAATEARNQNQQQITVSESGTMTEFIVDEYGLNFTAGLFADYLEDFIALNPLITLVWTNESKTECLLNFSGIIQWEKFNVVIGFSIFRRKFPFLRMTINSTVPIKFSKGSYQRFHLHRNPQDNFKKEHYYFYYLVDVIKKQTDLFYPKPDTLQIKKEEPFEIFSKMMTRNYPVLIPKFELNLLKIAQKSVPKNIESVIGSDSCELCDQLNGIQLNCGHNFCKSCSTFIFKKQIQNFEQNLKCPICQQIQDPYKLTTILPLSLIHVFLKNRFQQNTKYGIIECKKCSGIFEKIPDVHGIRCVKCEYIFCQKCHQVPHFPLTCEQFKIWEKKFSKQYKLSYMPSLTVWHDCPHCFTYVPQIPESHGFYTCPKESCRATLLPGKTFNVQYDYTHRRTYFERISQPSTLEIPNFISASFLNTILFVREQLQNKETKEIKKSLKEIFGHLCAFKFDLMRLQILSFLEFATAWLYLERQNSETQKWKQLDKNLDKLAVELVTVSNLILIRSSTRSKQVTTWLRQRRFLPKIDSKSRSISEAEEVLLRKSLNSLENNFLKLTQFFA